MPQEVLLDLGESRNKLSATERARKGGKARAESNTPEKRQAMARQAAEARWGTAIPKATHMGVLTLVDSTIPCAVLENGRRVLTQQGFMMTIGRSPRAKGGTGSERAAGAEGTDQFIPPFLAAENLRPFITEKAMGMLTPIVFRTPKGVKAHGYDAELLPEVCETYLAAADAEKILQSQERVVQVSKALMRGLARVAITALVDEATGYQAVREQDDLSLILAKYVVAELQPWIKKFPDEFFQEIFRLWGWEWHGTQARPRYIGQLINRYIYEQLPPGVLGELRNLNPTTESGRRRHKHHQYLTESTGDAHLEQQIKFTMMLMRISETRAVFDRNFSKAFKRPVQLDLLGEEDDL